jgi:hypothetical protein
MQSNSMSFASPNGSLSSRARASSADVTFMRKTGAFLILTNPPLVDFASQIKPNCIWHFPWKDRLYLLGVGGDKNRPMARTFVVGAAGKGPFRFSCVSAVFS